MLASVAKYNKRYTKAFRSLSKADKPSHGYMLTSGMQLYVISHMTFSCDSKCLCFQSDLCAFSYRVHVAVSQRMTVKHVFALACRHASDDAQQLYLCTVS